MEYDKSKKLREEWGEKPCDHSHIERHYYSGTFIIEYVCSQCGMEFSILEKLETEERRKKKVSTQRV